MASPAIASTGTTNGTTASATPALNLPSGIQQNDLLVGYFRAASAGAVTWPTGWNELVDASPDGADDQVSIAWKRATGAETGTITLASGGGKFGGIIRRITGAADPLVRPPEISTVATGTSPTQPNATTVTPTGGSKDYLFDTVYLMEGEQTGVTSYPANYTSGQTGLVNSGTAGATSTNVTLAAAGRQLTAASDDAGAWTIAGTLINWSAYTLVVHPPEASPDLAWMDRSDATARVIPPANPRQATNASFLAFTPWLNLDTEEISGAASETGGSLFGAAVVHTQQAAGPVSQGNGIPWLAQPQTPHTRAPQMPGLSVWTPFVEEPETPYPWLTNALQPIRQPISPPLDSGVLQRVEEVAETPWWWTDPPASTRLLPTVPQGRVTLPSIDTAGFNQPLAWHTHYAEVVQRPWRLVGPFFGDPTVTATLVVEIDGITLGGMPGSLWGQKVIHYQQAAGPVRVITLNVPEISWWPRMPGMIYRTPPARTFGVFPWRPLGDPLTNGPWGPSDDSVVRVTGPFGYQAWAGPIATADPSFLSDLPWIARLDPPIRRRPLTQVSVARPIEPPASVVHPVWQSQASTFLGIRRLPQPQIDPVPAHPLPFEETFAQLGWLPPLHEVLRRRPDPRVVTARSPFPLDASGLSDLPWLPPPLTFRALAAPWAPTPIQPWDPPVAVSDRAWLPPYHDIVRRVPPAPWGFALPPFPQDATSGSDLPWLQIPDPIRRVRWTPPDPWSQTLHPPEIPTYFPGQITQPIRRLIGARGPFTALPGIPTAGILWWPAPPVLEQPTTREGPPLWIPGWSLLIVGDQWCIQLSYEAATLPVLIEEIGIQASFINEIGLPAKLAAEEEC